MTVDHNLSPPGFPSERILWTNSAQVRREGACVIYWMTAFRRLEWNFALERAVAWAVDIRKPLVIVESWSALFPWASRRQLAFVADGMREKLKVLKNKSAFYLPFVETKAGQLSELFRRLAPLAACVVTDFYPLRPWRQQLTTIGENLPVLVEAVDGNGVIPLAAANKIFARAFDFRRFWQKQFLAFFQVQPTENPLDRLPRRLSVTGELAELLESTLSAAKELITEPAKQAAIRFACDVPPVDLPGGSLAARQRLESFILNKLPTYARDRDHPDLEATSGLSPYLHWGHISPHEILSAVMQAENWTPERCRRKADGSVGFFGMGDGAEVFLDQLLTWREIGFNFAYLSDRYDAFDSLPAWARRTLEEHAGDRRPYLYTKEQLEEAATIDRLWNAAQNELRTTGVLHNYMRMLWGKKILEWTRDPHEALAVMIDLNNKYGLDAEDPNSYSGIFWILGRYDRPWGPERPVFGTVRFMSTESAARKLKLKAYVRRFAPSDSPSLFQSGQ